VSILKWKTLTLKSRFLVNFLIINVEFIFAWYHCTSLYFTNWLDQYYFEVTLSYLVRHLRTGFLINRSTIVRFLSESTFWLSKLLEAVKFRRWKCEILMFMWLTNNKYLQSFIKKPEVLSSRQKNDYLEELINILFNSLTAVNIRHWICLYEPTAFFNKNRKKEFLSNNAYFIFERVLSK
jgi:hypothetical protein